MARRTRPRSKKSSCEGKEKLTERQALRVAFSLRRQGQPASAYRCGFCVLPGGRPGQRSWHVGRRNSGRSPRSGHGARGV
jgi:hypothetical protein